MKRRLKILFLSQPFLYPLDTGGKIRTAKLPALTNFLGSEFFTNPMTDSGRPPVVAHIIQRLAVGGLENGLVNLINHMPEDRYRHVIVCLADATDYSLADCAKKCFRDRFESTSGPGL